MPATPARKIASKKTQSTAQSLVGCSVAIPSNIFNESNSQYTGRVVGTPSRKKNAVYVKVDQDDTEYWFPADEVASWVIQDTRPKATGAVPKIPRTRKQKQQADSPHRESTAGSSQPADGQQKQALQNPTKGHDSTLINFMPTRAQDAVSCHPKKPDAFAETVEELVKAKLVCC